MEQIYPVVQIHNSLKVATRVKQAVKDMYGTQLDSSDRALNTRDGALCCTCNIECSSDHRTIGRM